MKTVGQLKDSLAGLLQGTNLNNITSLNPAIERGARSLIQQVDIPEASGRQNVTLYGGVYDYLAPTTIFGGALIDFRPQGISRSPLDYVYKKPIELFDRTKAFLPNGYNMTFEWKKGVGIMRVSSPNPKPQVILDPMNSTTGWTAAGSASGLALDYGTFYQSPASLRFTLTGSSAGTLTKAITQQNLSTYEDLGVVFLAVYIPTVANLTSITLKIGSSASAYDSVTATTGFLQAFTAGEFMLIPFDFSTSSSTGTPDWTAIDYAQVSIAHTGTETNFRVGQLFIALPSAHEVLFQSSAIFMASGSNPSLTITNDNDQIILSPAAYTLLEYESAIALAEQSSRGNRNPIAEAYKLKLYGNGSNDLGLYEKYRADNPSQEIREVGNYYYD